MILRLFLFTNLFFISNTVMAGSNYSKKFITTPFLKLSNEGSENPSGVEGKCNKEAYIDFLLYYKITLQDNCPHIGIQLESFANEVKQNNFTTCVIVSDYCNRNTAEPYLLLPSSEPCKDDLAWYFTVDENDCNKFFRKSQDELKCSASNLLPYINDNNRLNEFALKLNKGLNSNLFKVYSQKELNKNFVFSPLSVGAVVSMLYMGVTDKTTQNSIEKAFGYNFNEKEENIKKIVSLIKNIQFVKEVEVENNEIATKGIAFANGIWSTSVNFNQKYINDVQSCFNAEIKKVEQDKIVEVANKFIEENTLKLIKNMVPQGNYSDIFASANSLKLDWKTRFNKDQTSSSSENFTLLDGKKVKANMMSGSSIRVRYIENYHGNRIIVLPFNEEQGGANFIVVHPISNPKPVNPIEAFSKLDINKLIEEIYKHEELSATIKMPKFDIETTEPPLKEIINEKLSINFFDKEGLFKDITNDKLFKIVDATGKTVFKLNERGVEAASAAAVMTSRGAGPIEPLIEINSPFAFMIVHNQTKTIVYNGALFDPLQK